MDIFRRKKKAQTLPTSQEEPARGPAEKPPRHKKRHSIGDIGLLWNNKKQTGQNDLELPLSPHARAALPDQDAAKDLQVRVSKRRAPGPPRASPKRGTPVSERVSQNAIAKTTVCSTEVFHDSHIGHDVTSPASSLSGRFLAPPSYRKGSNSSGFSGSFFAPVPSPLGSVIQPLVSPSGSVIHESAIYRKPLATAPKDIPHIRVKNEADQMAKSLPNDVGLEKHIGRTLNTRNSTSNQDLSLVSECSATLYCDDNFILKKADRNTAVENEGRIDTKFLGEPVLTWTSKNVVDWCRLKGFNDYAELFEDSDIDGGNLIEITENDLVELDFDLPSLRPFMTEVEHLRRMRGTPETQLSVEEEVENIRIEYWTNDNVLHWLSISGLDRFLVDFEDAVVTGVDLVKLDMDMLDRLGIISNQDREDFLAKLYDTMSRQEALNGSSVGRGDSPGNKSDHPRDRHELPLAEASRVVMATDDVSARTGSGKKAGSGGSLKLGQKEVRSPKDGSVGQGIQKVLQIIDAQQDLNVLSNFDEEHIEQFKRACADLNEDELTTLYSEIGTRLLDAEKELLTVGREQDSNKRGHDIQDYEDRLLQAETVLTLLEEQKACILDTIQRNKVTSHIKKLTRSTLYDQLFTTSHEIVAVTIHHRTDDGFGFEVERQGLGGVVVTRREEGLPLETGDRLIELNSYNLSSAERDDVIKLLSASDWPLRMVVLRPVDKDAEGVKGPSSEEEALREDLMNVMKDLETAVEEKEDLERRNTRMVTMLRGLNNDKIRLQDHIAHLQDRVESTENDWGAVCTLLDKVHPDKDRDRGDHQSVIGDIGKIIQQMEDQRKDNENQNCPKLEPVPYDEYDDVRPLWENLRDKNKGVLLQALQDALTETQLRRDLDNRLISYLLAEAPHILAKMIQMDQISYSDVRQADSYLC